MSGFIRPEAQAALWRWREVLFGAFAVLLGLNWTLRAGGLLTYVGGALILLGAILIFLGVQRARFRNSGTGGPGAVDVDEGQVVYFGPMTGGAMAMRDMDELALIRTRQTPHWRLSAGQDALFIPVDAEGADALFDAFTALPDLNTERMLSALKDQGAHDTVIWERSAVRPTLH
jgi:hypothetical protein